MCSNSDVFTKWSFCPKQEPHACGPFQAALATLLRAAAEAELDTEDARYKLCDSASQS